MLSPTPAGRDYLRKLFLCFQGPAAVPANFFLLLLTMLLLSMQLSVMSSYDTKVLLSPSLSNTSRRHPNLVMVTTPTQTRFKPGFRNAPPFRVFARENWLNILTQLLCLTASILLYTFCPPILPRYFPNFDGVEMSAAGFRYAQPVRPEIIGTYPMAVLSYAIPAIVMGGLGLWVTRDFWDTNAAVSS